MIDERTVLAIERILARGDRAELIPGPEGSVKVLRIRRSLVRDSAESEKNNVSPS